MLDVVAAHDCGAAINPTAVESQIVGGVVMGLGAALGEELIYEGGRLVNAAYLHYALPRAADVPPIRPIVLGHADPRRPLRREGRRRDQHGAGGAGGGQRGRPRHRRPDPRAADHAGQGAGGAPRPGTAGRRRYRAVAPAGALVDRVDALGRTRAGVHAVLHRWGTRAGATRRRPPRVCELDRPAGAGRSADRAGRDRRRAAARRRHGPAAVRSSRGSADPAAWSTSRGVAELGDVRGAPGGRLVIGAGSRWPTSPAARGGPRPRPPPRHRRPSPRPQIREMATVGGNLCQAKRCWFYRNGFDCYKRRGVTAPCYAVLGDHRYYHAVLGAHRCQAVTPSDLATVLVALDARVADRGPGRPERTLPVGATLHGPRGDRARDRTRSSLPSTDPGRRSGPGERLREASPVGRRLRGGLGCASPGRRGGPGRATARIVLGAVAPTPYRAQAVERRLRGRRLDPRDDRGAAGAWTGPAHPLAGNEWKVDAACGLLRRCLEPAGTPMAPDDPAGGPACARAFTLPCKPVA